VPLRGIRPVLALVIDDTGTVFGSAEHRVCELPQPKFLNGIVFDKEELIGPGDDADIDLCNIVEALRDPGLYKLLEEVTGRGVEEGAGPFALNGLAIDRLGSTENLLRVAF